MRTRNAAKISLSLPDDLFRKVERVRKKHDKTRSALVQDALRSWLRQQSEATCVREWEKGYRYAPETRSEIQNAEVCARFAFDPKDEW